VVGAVIGIGLLHGVKGAKQIRWSVLGGIGAGWIATPVVAALICFVTLFFMQNVFNQQVYKEVFYELDEPTLEYLKTREVAVEPLTELKDKTLSSAVAFRDEIRRLTALDGAQEGLVIAAAEVFEMAITQERYALLDRPYLNAKQIEAIRKLMGERFRHRWQLEEALARLSEDWKPKPTTKPYKLYNKALREKLGYVENHFQIGSD
jgi:PiT family inorganic phosphate transporter